MAASINRVVLSGNLTKDPELRHTPQEMAVCELRLAVNGREKVNGTWRDRVEYVDVVVWANQGEACAQYLSKGSPVGVDGKLRFEEWEQKDGGGKRNRLRVVADNVQFLSDGQGRGGGGGGGGRSSYGSGDPDTDAVNFGDATGSNVDFSSADDDIPF